MDDLTRHHESPDSPPEGVFGIAVPNGTARVDVVDGSGRLAGGQAASLVAWSNAAVGHLNLTGEVRVRVVADAEMSAAHLEYCDVEGTTDVLTFDMSSEQDGSGRPVLDVDVMVCLDEAERQGKARGHAPERELLLYIVHALMHCLGHDDHDEVSASAMHAEEDRILAAIGVGATYAAPAAGGGA